MYNYTVTQTKKYGAGCDEATVKVSVRGAHQEDSQVPPLQAMLRGWQSIALLL